MLGPANFQIFSRIRDLEAKAFGSAVATVGGGLVSAVSGNRSKLISMRTQDRTSQKADAPSLGHEVGAANQGGDSFFFSSRRRHTRWNCDWSSDVCSSDLMRSRWFWINQLTPFDLPPSS